MEFFFFRRSTLFILSLFLCNGFSEQCSGPLFVIITIPYERKSVKGLTIRVYVRTRVCVFNFINRNNNSTLYSIFYPSQLLTLIILWSNRSLSQVFFPCDDDTFSSFVETSGVLHLLPEV